MVRWILFPAATAAVLFAAPAWADAGLAGFVDHTEWVSYGELSSLRVYPTPVARAVAARQDAEAEGEQAWSEVIADTPEADTPSMRDQFRCHWNYAELARPGKISWNLEPWRPVVDGVTMLETGCNPGAAEEAF